MQTSSQTPGLKVYSAEEYDRLVEQAKRVKQRQRELHMTPAELLKDRLASVSEKYGTFSVKRAEAIIRTDVA